MSNSEELELAKEVARKAKELAKEKEAKLLSSIRAEFYVQLSEVLKSGIVKAATWHVGDGRPAIDLGNANDLYVDKDSGDIFFNNAGDWSVVLNIKGRDGIDGKDGEKGDRGATGLAGERGKDGRDGKDGRNGKDGRDGVDGKNGKNGKDGKDGRDGSRWYTGLKVPTYSLGSVGDFYLKESGDFYEKTTPMNWERRGSLRGPSGPSGILGGSGGGGVSSVAGRTGDVVLTKSDVGLSSVDNTSDLDKPVSTATQTALDDKLEASDIADFETSSELNTRDTNNRARANHTGTQLASTISDFTSAIGTSGGVQSRDLGAHPFFQVASNTTTETRLIAALYNLTGGTIASGHIVNISCTGTVLNNTGSDVSYTLRIKVGAVTLVTQTFTVTTNATARAFSMNVPMLCVDFLGLRLSGAATLVIQDPSGGADTTKTVATVTTVIALASNQNIDATIQMDTANAQAQFNMYTLVLNVSNPI